jgi:flagellar hook protein FlgE
MLSSFFSGISGLVSNTHSINVVGNNIANVNTVGYKASRATFQDVLYQSIFGASGTSQVGRGASLSSVDTLFAQGSFETTSESTDLAIGGEGFFMVESPNNNTVYYTRAGQFRFDEQGYLTNPSGYILQGKAIDRTTNAPFGVDTDILISPEPSEPRKTELVGMAVNLQSDAAWAGSAGALATVVGTGNVTGLSGSEGKYARSGNYTATTALRTAATIDLTGTDAVTGPLGGTLTINGVAVDLTGVADLAALVTKIDAATAATKVDATANGGKLQLTATVDGTDIVVDDDGVNLGSIGWTAADKVNDGLKGATLALQVDQILSGASQGITTFDTANLWASGGTVTDWQGSGLDITYGATTVGGTQTFTVQGFVPDYESATVNPSSTSNYSSSVTVYDSIGQPHVVNVYFRKSHETEEPTQTSVWEWHAHLSATDSATGVETDVASGYLTFNNTGRLINGGDPISISFDFSQGAEPGQTIELVFGSDSGGGTTTQYPIASTTNFQTQDGYPPGVLTSVTVESDGTISGHYSNGQILDLYRITLAKFNNANGLGREGGNLFSETLESGVAYTNAPGEGSLGKINPNSLEQSNVDLATEFVKMIVAQRGFQANARVITTTDEILQELMNIKR